MVHRAEVVVHKAGPGERAYVPTKAAKLGRPKVDGVPRCEGNAAAAAGPACGKRVMNSRRCKATARKPARARKDFFDPEGLTAAISAAQAELEEEYLFG